MKPIDHVIVHKDFFAYISHPSITLASNGDWVAAFNHAIRRQPKLHPPNDPLFRTLVSRSTDQGQSWSVPEFAPDFDSYGTECPGIATTPDGTVLLSEFRFAWYPLGLARRKVSEGQRLAIAPSESGQWTTDFKSSEWDQTRFPWARGPHGVYVHRSTDHGQSFDQTVAIDTAPYVHGYSRTGIITLSDGRLAYALAEHGNDAVGRTYLVFSEDNGLTWSRPVPIVESFECRLSEPDIVETQPGELLCVLRQNTGPQLLHLSRSTDGGQTWTTPVPSPMNGKPGHLLKLADGRILCSYARRTAPFSILARLSDDGGRTWSEEMVVREGFPKGDLGYPTTIEYAPNRLFCCYYGQTDDGVTCVQGTWLDI